MKKIVISMAFLLILLLFCGCGVKHSSNIATKSAKTGEQKDTDQTNSNQENLNDYSMADVYELTGGTETFGMLISKNNIDRNYQKDFENSSELLDVEERYTTIWKDELQFSIHNYMRMLSKEDQVRFSQLQKQWEDSMINNLKFERDVLTNSDAYHVMQGSSFGSLWLSEVREAYRDRTIRIKYMTYLLETQTGNPKPIKDCLSLVFKN